MAKPVQLDENGYRKFGTVDKLAYAAGDFGCNMSFALKSYLTIFWTQYMGIDSILMASLLLLVQIWDAVNDPLIGALVDADRHQYKRNKFLTYIWVGSLGLMFGGAFCFLPFKGAPGMVKNILFVAGYIIWDAFYTIANVPYGSMLSIITTDPGERAQLSTYRSAGAMIGGILTGILIPMMIYDANSNLKGDVLFLIALFMGVLGFIAFQFMVRKTVVRVNTDITVSEEAPKFNVVKAVVNFCKNRAAMGVTLMALAQIICMYGVTTASQVMFQAYFKNARISGLLGMLSYCGLFIFMPFIGKLVAKFGKKECVTVGLGVSAVAYLLMLVLPITPDGKGLAMYAGCQVLAALGNGPSTCVGWSLVADFIDYGEWKTGERDEGTNYALYSFFRKLAQGIGPSLGLVIATMLGYNAALGSAQSAEVALTMRYMVAIGYLIGQTVQLIGIGLVYNLDKKTLAKINSDLAARKAAK